MTTRRTRNPQRRADAMAALARIRALAVQMGEGQRVPAYSLSRYSAFEIECLASGLTIYLDRLAVQRANAPK
jgi:hypothetical protein